MGGGWCNYIFEIHTHTKKFEFTKIASYKDSGNRSLRVAKGRSFDVKKCLTACSDYRYFSLQDHDECWCENSWTHATNQGRANCGDRGAGWCNMIYENNNYNKPDKNTFKGLMRWKHMVQQAGASGNSAVVSCTNGGFGTDPSPGSRKVCFCEKEQPNHPIWIAQQYAWDRLYCAKNAFFVRLRDDDGKRLTFDAAIEYFPYSIRPANGQYFTCQQSSFQGEDRNSGHIKNCFCDNDGYISSKRIKQDDQDYTTLLETRKLMQEERIENALVILD